jgi:peptidoglycan/xylan/chitin deacetylase (PgdA/CDA1 family)
VSERLRLCAISVDLDEIHHYYAIHGLGAPPATAAHAVYACALPRYEALAAAQRVPLTLFVVGADVARRENGVVLRRLAAQGHELGNHTFEHHYDLSRRPVAEIEAQIELANVAIAEHAGQRPTGFRAPGYVMSDNAYRAVAATCMAYSSSLFPCPYYYAAKLAVLTALRIGGKASSSIIDRPGVLSAPTRPYRVGEPYYRVGAGVLELPIQVTPRLRLPFFGTVLTGLGPALARRMARGLVGQELINLELHGVDLLDERDGLAGLRPHQVDLGLSLERKWAVLSDVIEVLRRAGYSFVRLDEAARRFAAR